MKFEQLMFQEEGDTARITLSRPDALNALSLSDEFVASIEEEITRTYHKQGEGYFVEFKKQVGESLDNEVVLLRSMMTALK